MSKIISKKTGKILSHPFSFGKILENKDCVVLAGELLIGAARPESTESLKKIAGSRCLTSCLEVVHL